MKNLNPSVAAGCLFVMGSLTLLLWASALHVALAATLFLAGSGCFLYGAIKDESIPTKTKRG